MPRGRARKPLVIIIGHITRRAPYRERALLLPRRPKPYPERALLLPRRPKLS